MPVESKPNRESPPSGNLGGPTYGNMLQAKAYELVDFAEIPGVPCPCGTARRALADVQDFPGTIHVTEISLDARTHYHRRLTETYYILECEPGAEMELDGE